MSKYRNEPSFSPQSKTSEHRVGKNNSSHAQALESTGIMGGSMVVVMMIRMIRTKILAILLGPTGVGLEAIFDSVLSLTRTAVDLGISSSGVRQIAAAVGSGNKEIIATTVLTLRRVCLLLGIFGAIALFLARDAISRIAFGSTAYSAAIGWLAIVPLLGGIAGGQGALLQGMRRIGDLAKMRILGTLATAVFSIPIVWIWGKEAIPAYLVLTAVITSLASWSYARRISIEQIDVPIFGIIREARNLLRLGFVFLATGLMMTGILFFLRVIVIRKFGVDGAGQFQAANALSMVYVGFVLQAMGADFYPRLTAAASDNERCNQLVNEQAEVSMLVALPGVLATVALSPWLIHTFYSSRFDTAAEILAWQATGVLLQVNVWPMGFIILAKGRAGVAFWAELAVYAVYAGLGWMGLKLFGLPGAGMAFLGHYIFHCALTYLIVRRMSGFRWSEENLRLVMLGGTCVAITLVARLYMAEPWATLVGCGLSVVAGIYCVKTLIRLIGVERVNHYLRKLRVPYRFRQPPMVAIPGYGLSAD